MSVLGIILSWKDFHFMYSYIYLFFFAQALQSTTKKENVSIFLNNVTSCVTCGYHKTLKKYLCDNKKYNNWFSWDINVYLNNKKFIF